MLSSLLDATISRLFLGAQCPLQISKVFASGRWWPQPQRVMNVTQHNRMGTSNGTQQTCSTNGSRDHITITSSSSESNVATKQDISASASANELSANNNDSSSSVDLELFRDKAAPIFVTPRGPGRKVYKTVQGKNGELLADYVLFEDSMNKAKVTWNEYSLLSSEERDIYMAHLKALRERKLSYKDPKTGYHVMCSSRLLLNGKCCGNGCRHCPYEHENAHPEIRKRRKWNGAFYV